MRGLLVGGALLIAVAGCVTQGDDRWAQMSQSVYEAINAGNADLGVQRAHATYDYVSRERAKENPYFLGTASALVSDAYIAQADERVRRGDRSGALAALDSAVAESRRTKSRDGYSFALIDVLLKTRPVLVRAKEDERLRLATEEINALIAEDPARYFTTNVVDQTAELAWALHETGQQDRALYVAQTVEREYENLWNKRVSGYEANIKAGNWEPVPRLLPRRGLTRVVAIRLASRQSPEALTALADYFATAGVLVVEGVDHDVAGMAAALRGAGLESVAGRVEGDAQTLRQALASNPYPSNASGSGYTGAMADWYRRIADSLRPDNMFRLSYLVQAEHEAEQLAREQLMALEERAYRAERNRQFLNALMPSLPALGMAAYGAASGNRQVMAAASRQLDALTAPPPATGPGYQTGSQSGVGPGSGSNPANCMPGPRCASADSEAQRIIATYNISGSRPASGAAFCSNKVVASVARICAGEMTEMGQSGCADLAARQAQASEETAAQHAGVSRSVNASANWEQGCNWIATLEGGGTRRF